MKRPKKFIITIVTVGLVTAVASPAYALVGKVGTKGCSANQLGQSIGYTTQVTYHKPPGDSTFKVLSVSSAWKTTKALASKTKGGDWAVMAEGSINNDKTYATCVSSGTP